MVNPVIEHLRFVLSQQSGFIFPNELELQWSILIVLYPYITGLVAGAFILASLAKIFNVKEIAPIYRLSLLSALAMLIVAPLPLQAHLGHPLRGFEIFVTPRFESAMGVFGFIYIWYLMAVVLIEIWLDYRPEIIKMAQTDVSVRRYFYKLLTLGITNVSEESLKWDERIGKIITVIGIPSAVLLHGYVGFIFGSLKANPWWSTTLMPVIFIFSATVSGIALVLFLYMVTGWIRKIYGEMNCLDTVAKYLFYFLVIDVSLESLDLLHRIYQAEESLDIISVLLKGKLYWSLFIVQGFLGTLIPLISIGIIQIFNIAPQIRRRVYFIDSMLVLLGIFAMRWNVVIGGQFFSKSLAGFTTYKLELIGQEGFLVAALILLLPFAILSVLLYLFPPWGEKIITERTQPVAHNG